MRNFDEFVRLCTVHLGHCCRGVKLIVKKKKIGNSTSEHLFTAAAVHTSHLFTSHITQTHCRIDTSDGDFHLYYIHLHDIVMLVQSIDFN